MIEERQEKHHDYNEYEKELTLLNYMQSIIVKLHAESTQCKADTTNICCTKKNIEKGIGGRESNLRADAFFRFLNNS